MISSDILDSLLQASSFTMVSDLNDFSRRSLIPGVPHLDFGCPLQPWSGSPLCSGLTFGVNFQWLLLTPLIAPKTLLSRAAYSSSTTFHHMTLLPTCRLSPKPIWNLIPILPANQCLCPPSKCMHTHTHTHTHTLTLLKTENYIPCQSFLYYAPSIILTFSLL